MTDNKNKCIKCGTICNHDDDAIDECRFCNSGIPVIESVYAENQRLHEASAKEALKENIDER